jgi:O-6-methylguanine DNA methyltransferase
MTVITPQTKRLYHYYETPIGTMLAVFSEKGLCGLDFIASKNVTATPARDTVDNPIIQPWVHLLERELETYFQGALTTFTIPLDLAETGTPFQRMVWQSLSTIPYGSTISYKQQACALGKPSAMRAVANANGKNRIAIIIPCHRVIGASGKLQGYASGIERKQFLLNLEQSR